jgi:hypothetical protein
MFSLVLPTMPGRLEREISVQKPISPAGQPSTEELRRG